MKGKVIKYSTVIKSVTKDTLVINNMATAQSWKGQQALFSLYRAFKLEVKPHPFLVVTFSILKKHPAWIKIWDQQIDFVYDLWKVPESEGYMLTFSMKQEITRGINLFRVPVNFDCTSKKELIKIFIEQLVEHYGDWKRYSGSADSGSKSTV